MNRNRLEVLYRSGDIHRLHSRRTLFRHTVAEHVYGAQLIAAELCYDNDLPLGPVLTWLLYHDSAEYRTGDIPGPTKRLLQTEKLREMEEQFYDDFDVVLPELSPTERLIVKVADKLDLAVFCIREREMGNRNPSNAATFERSLQYAQEVVQNDLSKLKGLEMLLDTMTTWWKFYSR